MNFKKASLISLVFITAFSLFLIFSVTAIQTTYEVTKSVSVENALRTSIVQCYALEGSYPPSVDYLAINYGVILDREKYIYHYQVFASNVMPVFSVIPKKVFENE